MLNSSFNSEELELLREVLERELREIDVEVFRTDSHDFKAILKQRKAMMEALLEKLSQNPVPS
jgi:hypothetical protein